MCNQASERNLLRSHCLILRIQHDSHVNKHTMMSCTTKRCSQCFWKHFKREIDDAITEKWLYLIHYTSLFTVAYQRQNLKSRLVILPSASRPMEPMAGGSVARRDFKRDFSTMLFGPILYECLTSYLEHICVSFLDFFGLFWNILVLLLL